MNEIHIFMKGKSVEVVELPGDHLPEDTLSVTIYGRHAANISRFRA